jgi:hypothetical protein
MSVRVMGYVWDYSEAHGLTRLVMLALADHADHEGECWPSVETIARKCRVGRRTVQRALDEAEAAGELVRVSGGGRGQSNRYRVLPVVVDNQDKPRQPDTVSVDNPVDKPRQPDTLSQETAPTVHETAPTTTINRATVGTQNRQEPSEPKPRAENDYTGVSPTTAYTRVTPKEELPARVAQLRKRLTAPPRHPRYGRGGDVRENDEPDR